MGEVIPFRKPPLADRNRGVTLCKNGFHKWEVWQEQKFDVKRGRLVTVYRCVRCGATRNEAH